MSALACATPISEAHLVDYWTDELAPDEVESIEEHLFGCAACTEALGRVQQLVAAVRASLPPVISPEQLAELRGSPLRIEENVFSPGHRREVTFHPALDLLIHHLTGLALADADRVSVTVRSEGSGVVMHEEAFAPFDRERGEVLIACQRHFASMPRDVVFDVRVHRPARPAELTTYPIPHIFIG